MMVIVVFLFLFFTIFCTEFPYINICPFVPLDRQPCWCVFANKLDPNAQHTVAFVPSSEDFRRPLHNLQVSAPPLISFTVSLLGDNRPQKSWSICSLSTETILHEFRFRVTSFCSLLILSATLLQLTFIRESIWRAYHFSTT